MRAVRPQLEFVQLCQRIKCHAVSRFACNCTQYTVVRPHHCQAIVPLAELPPEIEGGVW
jgi:hypothetical protein